MTISNGISTINTTIPVTLRVMKSDATTNKLTQKYRL